MASAIAASPMPTKEWTVLVFMNGKNNLEQAAIEDFLEMAAVGSSQKVNVVVELGRLDGTDVERRYGDWGGVRRFFITKGMVPTPAASVALVGEHIDMGDQKTLDAFLGWGRANYPANRYLVVVWNHGQGWRLMLRSNDEPATASFRTNADRTGGYRAISSDDEYNSIIYNQDVATSIRARFPEGVELIGFDACLMGMLETAYELRTAGRYMVGSEELEPGAGWNYTPILTYLTANPTADGAALATQIVDAYKEVYGDSDYTTLSAIRLDRIGAVAAEFDRLAISLQANLRTYRTAIRASRRQVIEYGSAYDSRLNTSVDLSFWLEQLSAQRAISADDKALIATVRAAIQRAVIANYASSLSNANAGYGSNGLAIYFPASKASFTADQWSTGYRVDNQVKPVAYVREGKWSEFLANYLSLGSPPR